MRDEEPEWSALDKRAERAWFPVAHAFRRIERPIEIKHRTLHDHLLDQMPELCIVVLKDTVRRISHRLLPSTQATARQPFAACRAGPLDNIGTKRKSIQ